ncbi:MAG: hypothetical protein V9E91_08160 [Burkholderiaceae bacterium]
MLIAEVRGAKKQEQLREKVAQHNALTSAQRAPASRGAVFAPIPSLSYREKRNDQAFCNPIKLIYGCSTL